MVVPPAMGSVATASTARPSPTPTPGAVPPPTATASTNPAAKAKVIPPSTAPGTLNGPPSGNNHAIPLSARRAEPLDLTTVERRGQQNYRRDDAPRRNRLFGIPDAPIFRPTEEEFRDPMEYMRKIAPEGRKHGIVKIIPPDNWNPPFAINTERFHFRTRRQELNSVEGGNRVYNDYLDQLAKFHKQNGHNLNRFPSVDKRPLDLYRLKKTVERKGGFDSVCKGKRWAEVGRDLGYSGKIMSSLSTSLKNSYQKWLLPYEEYLRLARPGVQQQLEMMNGGPYTPSPNPSPAKKQPAPVLQPGGEPNPTLQASAALHATINGSAPPSAPVVENKPAPPPPAAPAPSVGGFTPVNVGGFTAVNSHPPPQPTSSSFTAVNGLSAPQSNLSTPQRQTDNPPTNAHTPVSAPQATQPAPPPPALKRGPSELTMEEVEMINRRSKRLRKDVPTVVGSNMHHSRISTGTRYQASRDRPDYKPGEICESCGRPEEPQKRVVCQSCESAYHMYCLEPPLKSPPDHEWHCPRCLVGTNEYGFEEGDVYSLAGFQKKANEFKMQHFSTLPRQFSPFADGKGQLTEEHVEREFWRLVEDVADTTEVEYGADIHSTTHGSGFPTIERHPRDAYATDPWNLNILPLDKESLFRHIKSDVSGMTVPWLYVGMIFSTFCWHNEDHFTYSANYQHFGETKTWYGIPGEDSYKFEQAMRDEVPELFETQPDLLFQLVTLAKPEKLRKAGVRVYAVDQHAGQFVITYPRAYHAGFNHGFNFNEAVNFAPHDWEPFGDEGVKRLRDYRKQPCFSHDEMLLTAASRDHTIRTSKWLGPALERMRDEEVALRQQFLSPIKEDKEPDHNGETYQGPRYAHAPELVDPDEEEDEVICTFCKAYCYLSRMVCRKTGKVMCLLHAGHYECCDAVEPERYSGQNGEHVLFFRMSDDVLNTTVRKVVDKANIPEAWAAKVDNELEETALPSLKHLRTLLSEGEKIQYDLPQLPDLRRFVERCNEWVEEATNYITRKQTNRRKNEKVWRKNSTKPFEEDREMRSVDKIHTLLTNADQIGFDCPEIHTLRERAESITAFQRAAHDALADIRAKTTAEFEELVERGREFHVDIPEIGNLEKVLTRLRWNDLAKQKRPNPETLQQDQTLTEIEEFIQAGLDIGVSETNSDIVFFREHVSQGKLWEQKARELMAVEQVHYQQLDALSRQASTLPVNKDTHAAVEAILRKQREVQDKIQSLYERSRDPEFRNRPMYREVKDVMDALEELQSKPNGTIDLERECKRHEDWMRRGKKLFGKANAPLHILHQHMQLVEKRNEACFDLQDKPRGPVEPPSRQPTPEEDGAVVAEGSNSSRDVFCICRRSEAGMMIECELCHEWYHGKCLKIARGKVKGDDNYTCPICDWRVKIPRDAARPKLDDLQAWLDDLETLPFQPEEEATLTNICNAGQAFRDFIQPTVEPSMPPTADEVGVLRFYLRKIEGADILLAKETNYLRQELHHFAPVAPVAPPILEASGSTRKPRPTKQQKLMASLGLTNPDDLPQQYKMKPHIAKRNQISQGGKQTPLQPAGSTGSPNGSDNTGFLTDPSQPYPRGLGTPKTPAKKHLTALALHVLGRLAEAPVVDEFLATEPHANRDRLNRMKAVLEQNDPVILASLDKFKAKVNAMPAPPQHAQGYGYDSNNHATPTDRNSSNHNVPSPSPSTISSRAAPPTHLETPARFPAYPNAPTDTSPIPAQYDPQMFGPPSSGGMFETSPSLHGGAQDSNSGIDGERMHHHHRHHDDIEDEDDQHMRLRETAAAADNMFETPADADPNANIDPAFRDEVREASPLDGRDDGADGGLREGGAEDGVGGGIGQGDTGGYMDHAFAELVGEDISEEFAPLDAVRIKAKEGEESAVVGGAEKDKVGGMEGDKVVGESGKGETGDVAMGE